MVLVFAPPQELRNLPSVTQRSTAREVKSVQHMIRVYEIVLIRKDIIKLETLKDIMAHLPVHCIINPLAKKD